MRFVVPLLLLTTSLVAQPSLRERLLVAEDQRGASDADMAALKQGLGSQDPQTRRQAVRAIGRLERPDLMPLISRLLTDPVADVRIETANAIGQLARGAEGVAGAKSRLLIRVRAEKTPRVRGAIAATLGRLPFAAASDVREVERVLARMLPTGGDAQRTALVNLDEIAGAMEGLEALIRQSGKLAAPSDDTVARIRAAGAMEGRAQDAAILTRIRRLARAALAAAGSIDRSLLESGIADSDDEVRRLTMIAARAEIEGREAVVEKGLSDPNARVRYEALQTWGRTLQPRDCLPVLAAMRDENVHVRLLAIDLLGNGCAGEDAAVARTLQAVATTLTPGTRAWHAPAHAVVSLAKVAPVEARKLLPLYASHSVWQVRMYAARATATLGMSNELSALARDEHDNVREAALDALVTLKHPEAMSFALDALTRSDYQLVITAARALAGVTALDRGMPELLAALARITAGKRETSRDARMAILNRMEGWKWHGIDGSVFSAVRTYLHDFDPAVARKASEILGKWQQAAPPDPQPLPHPPVSLDAVDALAGSRLRFVMSGKGAFELRLLLDEAPLSSLRVATRAREGYYNGLTFHRVAPNFVIQGGSPGANEYAGDGPFMRDEVGLMSHRRGAVGISTRGRDTGDAQIFINLVDLPRLDHTYTVFAEVISGMDVVDTIVEGDVIERVEIVKDTKRPSDRR